MQPVVYIFSFEIFAFSSQHSKCYLISDLADISNTTSINIVSYRTHNPRMKWVKINVYYTPRDTSKELKPDLQTETCIQISQQLSIQESQKVETTEMSIK